MSEPVRDERKLNEIIESYGPHSPGAAAPLVRDMLRARGYEPRNLTAQEKAELDARTVEAMAEAERFWAEHVRDVA